jgi:hypothetical protein
MKSIFISTFIILFGVIQLQAQDDFGKIEVKKGYPKYAFKKGELALSIEEIASIIRKNEQAYKLIKPAKVYDTLGEGLAIFGSAAVVVPIGQVILGSSTKYFWPFVGIGVGLYAISIPITVKAEKQAAKAIELYNSSLSSKVDKPDQLKLKLGPTYNGIGLTLKF